MAPVNVDERDIADLAALHVSCLSDSVTASLGARYLKSFYRYVTSSNKEIALVERNNAGRIIAAVVVTLDIASLNRRLLFHTSLLLDLIAHPRQMRSLVFARDSGDGHELPEMILIYTSPHERGRGHGTALIDQAEQRMRQRNIAEYQVKTVADPSNPALAFYRKKKFTPAGTSHTLGRDFQVFTRRLDS